MSALSDKRIDEAAQRITTHVFRETWPHIEGYANEFALKMWNAMFDVIDDLYWEAERGEISCKEAISEMRHRAHVVLDEFRKEREMPQP